MLWRNEIGRTMIEMDAAAVHGAVNGISIGDNPADVGLTGVMLRP